MIPTSQQPYVIIHPWARRITAKRFTSSSKLSDEPSTFSSPRSIAHIACGVRQIFTPSPTNSSTAQCSIHDYERPRHNKFMSLRERPFSREIPFDNRQPQTLPPIEACRAQYQSRAVSKLLNKISTINPFILRFRSPIPGPTIGIGPRPPPGP